MSDTYFPILLAEFLIKSAVIIILGFGVSLLLRKSTAATKHHFWLCLFAGSVLIPLLLVALPRWQVLPEFWWSGSESEQLPVSTEFFSGDASVVNAASNTSPSDGLAASGPSGSAKIGWVFVGVWVLGVVVLLLQSVFARLVLAGFTRRSHAIPESMDAVFRNVVDCAGACRSPRLVLCEQIRAPFSWGIFRPVIVLPTSAVDWQRDELEMIFLHELSHVERRDAVAVLVARLFLCLNWLNPLSWVANRQAVQHREEACDQRVVQQGYPVQAYAEMLFKQAQVITSRSIRHCATAVNENGTIEQRIKMILNPISNPSGKSSKLVTILSIITIVAIGIAGSQDGRSDAVAEPVVGKPDPVGSVAYKLKNIRIPSLEFSDTPMEDAIQFLQQKSVELDPAAEAKGVSIVIDNKVSSKTPISLRLTNVPLGEALRYTSALSGAHYRVDPYAVVILPGQGKSQAEANKSAAIALNEKKLEQTVLPALEFKDTPLPDALAFLRQKSVELDSVESDPSRRGINLILKASPEAKPQEARITLKLTNAPLSAVLDYTCQLTNAEYQVEAHAVVVRVP